MRPVQVCFRGLGIARFNEELTEPVMGLAVIGVQFRSSAVKSDGIVCSTEIFVHSAAKIRKTGVLFPVRWNPFQGALGITHGVAVDEAINKRCMRIGVARCQSAGLLQDY